MISGIEKNLNRAMIAMQSNALKELWAYLNENSPYYKELFQKHKIDIDSIVSISDLEKIPVTTKDTLQTRNWDFLCVGKNRIAEYCTTSGTLGLPVTIALTSNDLDRLALNEYQSFLTAGANADDVFQFMLSLDRQFMAGIAYYTGVRKLGAGIVRVGPGNTSMQLDSIKRFQPTVLIAVPSFLISVIKTAKEKHFNLNSSSVKKVICIGENIRNEDFTLNALGKRIKEDWNVELYSTYASTEKQTAFTECSEGKGGHHQPDLIIFEVLDEQNRQVGPGILGELVISTIGVEGMPLLRYKTGDICSYYIDKCKCGKDTSRLSPIVGRKQHLIKYNGTTLYPQNIFNVLNVQDDIEDYVVILNKNELGTDDLQIIVALANQDLNPKPHHIKLLQSALRISPVLKYATLKEVSELQLQEGKRKPSKFIDLRV